MGFFLDPQEAKELIREDRRNAKVVKPAMGGQELNNAIEIANYQRWIVDFFETPLEAAKTYEKPF